MESDHRRRSWSFRCLAAAVALAVEIGLGSAAQAVSMSVSSGQGRPGDTVNICVDLATEGREVAGVQLDLVWNPECAQIDAASCRAGDHNKPLHKSKKSDSRLRVLVLALDNVDPIPDGTRLFCCDFTIPPETTIANCSVGLQNLGASDSAGHALTSGALGGVIAIAGGPRGDTQRAGEGRGPAAGGLRVSNAPGVAAEPLASTLQPQPAGAGRAVTGGTEAAKAPAVVAPGVPGTVQENQGPEASTGEAATGAPVAEPQPRTAGGQGGEPAEARAASSAIDTPKTPQATVTEARATPTSAPRSTPSEVRVRLATPTERAEKSACQVIGGKSSRSSTVLLALGGLVLLVRRGRQGQG